ncbi:Imm25 family immunity protein [Longitalea luteola]|uniref:Imm25 family immunity protein n=1 Tax=Longitalea luteola TaxID=2812563 RepID=UPI001A973F05|nr:Imm25 family immunity protein [Longitalea luteola]
MSEFYSVVNEFDTLISKYDFKSPKKLWYDNMIALSKHIDDIFYCYVIARVYKQDGSLETNLWVGPVDRPDDGLESLSAHIKVEIGYNKTLDENFFKDCESRIIEMIEGGALDSLMQKSKKELANPSEKNRAYEVYTQFTLPFYKMVLTEANNDKKILNNKKKCQPIIEKVLAAMDGEQKEFFNKIGLKETVDLIWELCYIYSL